MSHMNPSGRVGKHLETVVFGPCPVGLRGEGLVGSPSVLDSLFNVVKGVKRIAHRDSLD